MNILRHLIAPFVVLMLTLVLFAWYISSLTIGYDGVAVVKNGTSVRRVVEKLFLYNNSYIGKKLALAYLSGNVKIGNYSFVASQSIASIVLRVAKGESDLCSITFVPGKTFHFYKDQLASNDNFSGKITVEIEDGYILPDTYTHRCQSSRDSVLIHAKAQMKSFLESVLSSVDFSSFYLKNPHEVLTMASIVEKETGIASERSLIASVFKNRLELGMRLQTDPTVIYQESDKKGDLGRSLTKDDLRSEGLYNTYTRGGLPIGPIANPSREAIRAVLSPEDSDYLYFVATGNGGHNFSKNYKQHMLYIQSYIKASKENVPRGT